MNTQQTPTHTNTHPKCITIRNAYGKNNEEEGDEHTQAEVKGEGSKRR